MSHLISALDLGTSKVAVAQGVPDGSERVRVLGVSAVPYSGLGALEYQREDELTERVSRARYEATKMSGKFIKSMLVSVPGEYLNLELVRVGDYFNRKLKHADLDELLRHPRLNTPAPGNVVLHKIPITFIADGKAYSAFPEDVNVKEFDVCVAYIQSEERFHEMVDHVLTSLGIDVLGYVAGPAVTSSGILKTEMFAGDILVVDVGATSTDITAASPQGAYFSYNLDTGGVDITSDIAASLNVDFYNAEEAKRKQSTSMMSQSVRVGDRSYSLQSVVDSRVYNIARAVKNVLVSSNVDMERISYVYLTGNGIAPLRGGREIFSHVLDKFVKITPGMTTLINGNTCNTAVSILLYYMQYVQTDNSGSFLDRVRKLFSQQ